jgi:TadE-like protein
MPIFCHRHRSRGQSLVEFALVLPILLVLLLTVVDVGRLFYGWVALQNSSRIAANFAASNPDAWSVAGDPRQAQYSTQIQNDTSTTNCPVSTPIATPSFSDANHTIGSDATVSLSCQFHLLTPFLGNILGNPMTLGASTVYPIRAGIVGLNANTSPSPDPSPSPSPSASPGPCKVPTFIGSGANQADTAWKKAGFTAGNLTVAFGQPSNYTINTEGPSGSDGTTQTCATFTLTVGP